jgi:hypothetical protein
MKRFLATFACALAAFAGASAWACTDPGGIGGTGIDGGGIGGTGQRAEAEVGVLGVVTGFASICVNGIEVHYDAKTPVSLNGDPSSASALGIGQVVSVRAVGAGTQARAQSIEIIDAVVGRINAVEGTGTLLQVNGQRVRIDSSTVLTPGLTRSQLAAAQVGDTIRVSGLRDADGSIVATRIEAAAPAARALVAEAAAPGLGRFLVEGYVSDVQQEALRVGAMGFGVTPELRAQLAPGQLVRLSGRSEGGNRIVERADFLSGPFDVRPQRTLRMESPPRSGDDRRRGGEGDRSGRDSGDRGGGDLDRSGRDAGDIDRSGRGGGDRPERIDRSGPGDRPERVDRSGPSDRPERLDRSGRR